MRRTRKGTPGPVWRGEAQRALLLGGARGAVCTPQFGGSAIPSS
jgi:hypothetical protein